jgi:Flp pilus assembly protein TadD
MKTRCAAIFLLLMSMALWAGCSQTKVIRGERRQSLTSGNGLHVPHRTATDQALSDGISLYRSGELESAAAHFRKALAADPENWMAPYYLGLIALHNRDWQKAETDLHKSLSLASNDTRIRCRIYLALGQIAEAQGQAATARLNYTTALNLWPKSSPARDAIARLDRRDQLHPDSP